MPQPIDLSEVTERGADVSRQRPAPAMKIAIIAAGWSEVEEELAELLVVMLHADQGAVAAVFYGLVNWQARRDALVKVAEQMLPLNLKTKLCNSATKESLLT
jgi:hypothetical protein